jgi:D-glycero-D-manno-heptose 1,7-bisphosphate phosphatase
MQKAVFLDRDGVINRAVMRDGKPYPPANLAALEILPGVGGAMQSLHNAGWLLIVVTNQPDVARGTTSRSDVEAINQHLQQCLKPKPNLLYLKTILYL